ncbi:MAG: hypothetical protein DMF53_24505 [Acidobacteria bacterium]|nr:MAG: hypothetical protein DMF53_24505 [Acidobacteriota bacterium]
MFRVRWLALLAAAVLPGTGRDAALRLFKDLGPDGFAVETGNGGQIVGHLDLFDERLIEALHVVACLVRSPEALANVLEAAGQSPEWDRRSVGGLEIPGDIHLRESSRRPPHPKNTPSECHASASRFGWLTGSPGIQMRWLWKGM